MKYVQKSSYALMERARQLRKEMTPAENVLWHALRDHQLEGKHFRRQQPVGPFVADFLCENAKLAIEIDGAVHHEQVEYDTERTAWLNLNGYRVVRFSNQNVLERIDWVLERIRELIKE